MGLEGTGHHHMMSYVSKGVATIAYYDSKFVHDLRKWTCTCSTAVENSLVGIWSCPGFFYSEKVTITADYEDNFTENRSNDAVLFCKDCWQKSSMGLDLAWGQWDGTGYTSFKQCKSNAESAGVRYFAWTGQVYNGYCKVLKPSVTVPNLNTNQGYGYKLWQNTCLDCWKESTEGVDLAPGQWTGTGGTSFEQCKSNADAAGVLYFAWTGQVYGGYCKILNSGVTSPNLGTNQGYGYKLWLNKCQKCDEDFASISTDADRDAYVKNCVDRGRYKEMVCPVMRALMGSGFLRWKSSEGGIPLDDIRSAIANVLGLTGGLLGFFSDMLHFFPDALSDNDTILHFLRLPSLGADHSASSGIVGAATGGTISDSDAFNEAEFDLLLQHSSNSEFSLSQWGDAVNFFAGRRYDEANTYTLCPADPDFAGCNEWESNSLSGAAFPAIKDQAGCRSKCALNADCTSYILHPQQGCQLYKTLDGCTGNGGWTGYQMHCGVDIAWRENPFSWVALTFEYAAVMLIFGRSDQSITVDAVTKLWKEAKIPVGFVPAENNERSVDWTDIEALVEFMDIEVHPDAMAIMDSFGPEMEFFQNIATNTCGDGWNHCRAQEATVVGGVAPDFVDVAIPDGPDVVADNTASGANDAGAGGSTSIANGAAGTAAGPGVPEIDSLQGKRLRRLLKYLSNTNR